VFLNLQNHSNLNQNALVDSYGKTLSYQELIDFSLSLKSFFKKRSLIFIISNNETGCAALYYTCLANEIVPLIIGTEVSKEQFSNLKETYKPQYICYPERFKEKWEAPSGDFMESFLNINVCKTSFDNTSLNPELALLLSTSGSTGSPKLVRHSYKNIEANAKNVAEVFNMTSVHRPIAFLPLQYTMGLSVLTSHLFAGATVYLTDLNLTDKKFWNYFESSRITNLTGVPFTFEILNKLRFFRKPNISLEIISQGGGKLDEKLFETIAIYCKESNILFIPTYGQTEGTARMCFLPSKQTLSKICSIGKAIPGGKVYLVDEENKIIDRPQESGELIYEGPNVTLGYAETMDDLARGNDFKEKLFTGDIAQMDEDGFLFIVGRKKRFLKLYGLRISLDVLENAIKNKFNTDVYCTGDDKKLKIIITKNNLKEKVRGYVLDFSQLYHKSVEVIYMERIPRSKSGKIISSEL
jgi:acyl-coenzyme A synthetase/AMP-(fatty) acid ligase